jgi:hypothetical protein
MKTLKIQVEPELLEAIDKRCELAGLTRERLLYFDVKFANMRYRQNALEIMNRATQ